MTNDINDLQDDVVIGNYPTIPYVRNTAGREVLAKWKFQGRKA